MFAMFATSKLPSPLSTSSFSIGQGAFLNADRCAYSWYYGYHLIMP